jgi:hypothetical protein
MGLQTYQERREVLRIEELLLFLVTSDQYGKE